MMRRHILTWIAGALILLMLLPHAALTEEQTEGQAAAPDILTMRVKEPDGKDHGWNRILSAFTLNVDFGQGMNPVQPVMRYAHYGPIYADGIIFQSSLDYALKPIFGAIPEAAWIGGLQIEMAVEEDLKARCSWQLWRWGSDTYERIVETHPVAEALGAGRYLLLIDLDLNYEDAEWGNQSFTGTAFLWLNVGTEDTVTQS